MLGLPPHRLAAARRRSRGRGPCPGSRPPSLRSCSHWPAKFSTNCVGPGVVEHPDDLPAEVRPQRPLAGLAEQLVVGHAAPEEVREPAGQLELGQRAVLARLLGLDQEQELRRGEDRRQGDLDGALEALAPVVGQPEDPAGSGPPRPAAPAAGRPARRTGRSPGGRSRAATRRRYPGVAEQDPPMRLGERRRRRAGRGRGRPSSRRAARARRRSAGRRSRWRRPPRAWRRSRSPPGRGRARRGPGCPPRRPSSQ